MISSLKRVPSTCRPLDCDVACRAGSTARACVCLQGSTLTARAKLRHAVLHSVSASVNERTGPVLAAKSKCGSQH